jgi:hypothetical protein
LAKKMDRRVKPGDDSGWIILTDSSGATTAPSQSPFRSAGITGSSKCE